MEKMIIAKFKKLVSYNLYANSCLFSQYENKPNFSAIGKKIDAILKKRFLDKRVVIRCISSKNHGKSADELVKLIKQFGTDRYDSSRKGEKYENVERKDIDFFAIDFNINEKGEYARSFLEPFYYAPLGEGKEPVRIDIMIVYDRTKVKRVLHRYEGRTDMKRDGFVFKNPHNKPAALLGIIKIL